MIKRMVLQFRLTSLELERLRAWAAKDQTTIAEQLRRAIEDRRQARKRDKQK